MSKHNPYFRKRRKQISAHFSLVLFTLLCFICAIILIGSYTVFNGPSQR